MDDTAVPEGLVLLCPRRPGNRSAPHTQLLPQECNKPTKQRKHPYLLWLLDASFVRSRKSSASWRRKNSFFDWVTEPQRVLVGQVSQTSESHVSVVLTMRLLFRGTGSEGEEQTRALFSGPRGWLSDCATVRPTASSTDLVTGSDDEQQQCAACTCAQVTQASGQPKRHESFVPTIF
jgi:hypothetical protein